MFEVEYTIEEDVYKYPILRFILQPLVENALYHGIRDSGRKGIIAIGAYLKEIMYSFRILFQN
ncbi:hypothetical protein EHS13_27900 [Paenibacillus psychroresistens]|uniref:Uncharacterized protein n=1 Tax=Paenibacillus psychroresistens TaxID=1778678 RepID=A0A6B8RRF3_9BACL|nr:hypothetical protein [Paenibacillus psychroresistens]QGQ98437.1 hypothetical protein EHS13_27900 [Paenibacillus psychroresistens]